MPLTSIPSRVKALVGARLSQRGFLLIEGLIAILIFSTGVLAIFGLQAASIRDSNDAKYRADASFLADQIIGFMWSDRMALPTYAHQTAGTCPARAASGNANVTSWQADADMLLGANSRHQIVVTPIVGSPTGGARVTVTLCWQSPQDTNFHSYTAIAQIDG